MFHARIPVSRAALILLLAAGCGAPAADAHPPRPADPRGSAGAAVAPAPAETCAGR